MKIKSVKGTNDYLPKEARLRDYLQKVILETYQSFGFERIMTPALEDMENLDKSEGGENLSLLFKILKRGDKLEKAISDGNYEDISDIGLRYDLTLPLSRYYANNKSRLIMPFKCIQIDKVYRAERPQKGRLREFIQCDIDILGSNSSYCEVELIDITAKALLRIGMNNFTVKINDRRLLKDVLLQIGFLEDQLDSICISLDKLDKIGFTGLEDELLKKGIDSSKIINLKEILDKTPSTVEDIKKLCNNTEVIDSLTTIIALTNQISRGEYKVELDLTLVRGQGYYTGTIFEIESSEFRGSIAGGGRYDNLIGKFLNETVPAVGFSIGFERIFAILSEKGYKIPTHKERIAVIYDSADFKLAYDISENFRKDYDVAFYERPKKVGKLFDKLEELEYRGYYIVGKSEEIQMFK